MAHSWKETENSGKESKSCINYELQRLESKKGLLNEFVLSKIEMHGNMLQAYSHLYKTFAEDIRESDLLRAEMLKERQAAAAKEPKV